MKSLLLLMSSSLRFFNKFSKQTLLSSSFDSLGSLNVYVSLPRHLTCRFFTLLLVMDIFGAQGRIWRIRHTCIICIAKSKTGSKEKNRSYNQIKMCTCVDCAGWDVNSFCMISLYKFFWEHGYLFILFSSFFQGPSWAPCFSFFSIREPSCVHFFDSPCLIF